jgi:hypothetical protein
MSYPARRDRLWVLGVKQWECDANFLHVVEKLRILGGILPSSLLRIVQTGSGVYTASYSTGTGVSSRGEKRPGRDGDHSTPSAPQYAFSSLRSIERPIQRVPGFLPRGKSGRGVMTTVLHLLHSMSLQVCW